MIKFYLAVKGYSHLYLLFPFRFGDIGVASLCVNISDDLCVNVVPFLALLIIFYAFRVFSLIDFEKGFGGGGSGYGGGGGDLFGGLGGIFGGLSGTGKQCNKI